MAYYVHPDLYFPIHVYASEFYIDADLILAVILTESGGDQLAVGDDRHSFGLMQLHVQGAGSGVDPRELLDVPTNIRMGTAYLADMINRTGSLQDGLSAYNQGFAGWQARGEAFNAGYVSTVLGWRAELMRFGWDFKRVKLVEFVS